MKVPIQPTKDQKKALKAKTKEGVAKAQEERKVRFKKFDKDMDALKAVKQMTTPKGYSSDPLKPRGGTEEPAQQQARPKFGR